jgi:hypothetical protein
MRLAALLGDSWEGHMHAIKAIQALAGMLLVTATRVMATPLLQDPPAKIEVTTRDTHTVWYTNPVWLAIGGLAILFIIVLIVMAARGKDSGPNTTVVR